MGGEECYTILPGSPLPHLLAGQPFDPTFLLSCSGSNIICSLVFGERFEYTDQSFLTLLDLINSNWKLMSSTWGQVGLIGRKRLAFPGAPEGKPRCGQAHVDSSRGPNPMNFHEVPQVCIYATCCAFPLLPWFISCLVNSGPSASLGLAVVMWDGLVLTCICQAAEGTRQRPLGQTTLERKANFILYR